ncbi:hypothetical protein ACO0LC_26905 [Undibacterium sp. JH2W]|uniref:hypothetical protein n=1 Tax=Undibacterium sp. JH2W TaxID=3413037 RepID=UPI003BEFED78
MQFLFDFYKIADTERLYDEKVDDALELKQHFEKVSQRLGYQQFPKLSFVNMMGQHFLNEKKLKNAHDFLEMNVKNYPNNPLSYEGMGDYYQAAGEQAKAKEAYQQAVNLDANSRAKEKLEKLTK